MSEYSIRKAMGKMRNCGVRNAEGKMRNGMCNSFHYFQHIRAVHTAQTHAYTRD